MGVFKGRTSIVGKEYPRRESASKQAEWIAIDAFAYALENRQGIVLNRIECVPRNDDPPDFRITIAGEELGVEVVMVSDGNLERNARFREFVAAFSLHASRSLSELGRIGVCMRGNPEIPNPKSRVGQVAIGNALKEMRKAFSDPDQREQGYELNVDGINSISFCWLGACVAPVEIVQIMTEISCEEETRDKVSKRVLSQASTKVAKLAKNAFPVERCILLLFDDFGLSDAQEVIEDAANHVVLRRFHSVGWIPGGHFRKNVIKPILHGRTCEFLWSCRPDWLER